MTNDFQINDHILQKECDALAKEIFDDFKRDAGSGFDPDAARDDMLERAFETADGHEWVIYTYKALMLCAHCDTSRGEEFTEDCGGFQPGETFDDMATKIAFGEMERRIVEALEDLISEYEAPDEDDEDDASDSEAGGVA